MYQEHGTNNNEVFLEYHLRLSREAFQFNLQALGSEIQVLYVKLKN